LPSAAFLEARRAHLLAIGRADLLELPEPRSQDAAPDLRGVEYMNFLVAQERE
jgi:hypothetical protein